MTTYRAGIGTSALHRGVVCLFCSLGILLRSGSLFPKNYKNMNHLVFCFLFYLINSALSVMEGYLTILATILLSSHLTLFVLLCAKIIKEF